VLSDCLYTARNFETDRLHIRPHSSDSTAEWVAVREEDVGCLVADLVADSVADWVSESIVEAVPDDHWRPVSAAGSSSIPHTDPLGDGPLDLGHDADSQTAAHHDRLEPLRSVRYLSIDDAVTHHLHSSFDCPPSSDGHPEIDGDRPLGALDRVDPLCSSSTTAPSIYVPLTTIAVSYVLCSARSMIRALTLSIYGPSAETLSVQTATSTTILVIASETVHFVDCVLTICGHRRCPKSHHCPSYYRPNWECPLISIWIAIVIWIDAVDFVVIYGVEIGDPQRTPCPTMNCQSCCRPTSSCSEFDF